MRRALILGALFLLALGCVGGVWLYANRDAPVELRHPPLPADTLARYRAAVEAAPRIGVPGDEPLMRAFSALNRADVADVEGQGSKSPGTGAGTGAEAGEGAAPGLAVALAGFDAEVEQYLSEYPPELFLDLGRRAALRFVDALAGFLEHCRTAGFGLRRCLAGGSEAPAVAAYVELGGGFVRLAARSGLIEGGALPAADDAGEAEGAWHIAPGREPLVVAVFLAHWARAARPYQPIEGFMRGEELSWLSRWRAEFQLDGATDRRVAAALALADEPGYPAELNAGALLFAAGRYAEALEHFKRAPEPEAALYARVAARKAGDGPAAGSSPPPP